MAATLAASLLLGGCANRHDGPGQPETLPPATDGTSLSDPAAGQSNEGGAAEAPLIPQPVPLLHEAPPASPEMARATAFGLELTHAIVERLQATEGAASRRHQFGPIPDPAARPDGSMMISFSSRPDQSIGSFDPEKVAGFHGYTEIYDTGQVFSSMSFTNPASGDYSLLRAGFVLPKEHPLRLAAADPQIAPSADLFAKAYDLSTYANNPKKLLPLLKTVSWWQKKDGVIGQGEIAAFPTTADPYGPQVLQAGGFGQRSTPAAELALLEPLLDNMPTGS